MHWVLFFFFFFNLINDGLDTYKLYGFQQQQEVVSPIPDLLKGGKGSWAGNTAHGLSDHRLAGSVWQVAVTNTGCFLSHKQNAFCRAQHILEVFIMEVLWMQWWVFDAPVRRFLQCRYRELLRSHQIIPVQFLVGGNLLRCSVCRACLQALGTRSRWNALLGFFICFAPVLSHGCRDRAKLGDYRRKRKGGGRPKILNISFHVGHLPFAKGSVLPNNSKEIL